MYMSIYGTRSLSRDIELVRDVCVCVCMVVYVCIHVHVRVCVCVCVCILSGSVHQEGLGALKLGYQ